MNAFRWMTARRFSLYCGGIAIIAWVLTDVLYTVARFMQGSRIELEADDGEYHDGEEYQQTDLQERRHCLDDGLEHHLKTCSQ